MAGWLCCCWVPVLAILIWIIRRLMKAKSNRGLRIGFIVLFVIGLIAGGLFLNAVFQDFRYVSEPVAAPVVLSNAKVDKLSIELNRKPALFRYQRGWFITGEAARFLGDSARLNNTRLILKPATADSFSVSVIRLSNGSSVQDADQRAAAIRTGEITQQGENLMVPCSITIDKVNKFRNQYVLVTVFVPVGKKIEVHANRHWDNRFYVRFWGDDWNDFDADDMDEYYDMRASLDWDYDREYMMTKNGLEPTESDLQTGKERIESSEEIIEREQHKIKEEKDKIRRNLEEQKQQLQQQFDQGKKDLENKTEKIKGVLPDDSATTSVLGPAPMLWIGKSLLRLS